MKYAELSIQELRALLQQAADGDEDFFQEVKNNGGTYNHSRQQCARKLGIKLRAEISNEDLNSLDFIRENPEDYGLNDPDNK